MFNYEIIILILTFRLKMQQNTFYYFISKVRRCENKNDHWRKMECFDIWLLKLFRVKNSRDIKCIYLSDWRNTIFSKFPSLGLFYRTVLEKWKLLHAFTNSHCQALLSTRLQARCTCTCFSLKNLQKDPKIKWVT